MSYHFASSGMELHEAGDAQVDVALLATRLWVAFAPRLIRAGALFHEGNHQVVDPVIADVLGDPDAC